jgi:hypothetical protein
MLIRKKGTDWKGGIFDRLLTMRLNELEISQLNQAEKSSVRRSTKTTSKEGSSEHPATDQATPYATHLHHQSP